MNRAFLLGAALICGLSFSAQAAYTEVDISGFTNNSPQLGQGTYPTGSTTGNQGLGVPFLLAGSNGNLRIYLSPSDNASATLDLTPLDLTGQATFYTLLNNYYGQKEVDEYTITITTAQGPSVSFESYGGVDTRDYNNNPATTNSLAPTTKEWFSNQASPQSTRYQRLDLRQFSLPASFADDTLTGFTIKQDNNRDLAFFSGLTFSTDAGVLSVPEPTTMSLALVGVLGLLCVRRRA